MFCREFVASQIRGSLSLDHSTPFRVDCVGVSAQEALDHLLNSSFEYNLVLMDMSMPGAPDRNRAGTPPPLQYVCTTLFFFCGTKCVSVLFLASIGIWVTQKYKSFRPLSSTQFCCLSGLGRDELVLKQCRAAGMVKPYALGKPLDREELLLLISTTIGRVAN